MLVREAKLSGTQQQYERLNEGIRTFQCIQNRCLRLWVDVKGTSKNDLQKYCAVLAQDAAQPWMSKLNSQARQAAAERTWIAISSFYRRCTQGSGKKGYPKFKKHSRSIEYKTTGWKTSSDGTTIAFTDGFATGAMGLWMDGKARQLVLSSKVNRVRVVRRADGYYAQFCLDIERTDKPEHTGTVVGIDLGLKYFIKDSNGQGVECPKLYRKARKRLKKAQRRLSKRFSKGAKPQSKNYHKQKKRVGIVHLKVQRQRKSFCLEQARRVVMSNDIVAYENLQVRNMVRNKHLSKSISDAGWSLFTKWLDYYGKVWNKVVVGINPAYTTQDCSSCKFRVVKSLSTRTHSCPRCGLVICRDENAAINILRKGLEIVGCSWNSTEGHSGTASFEGTPGEMSTAFLVEQSAKLSTVVEPGIESSDASRIPVL